MKTRTAVNRCFTYGYSEPSVSWHQKCPAAWQPREGLSWPPMRWTVPQGDAQVLATLFPQGEQAFRSFEKSSRFGELAELRKKRYKPVVKGKC